MQSLQKQVLHVKQAARPVWCILVVRKRCRRPITSALKNTGGDSAGPSHHMYPSLFSLTVSGFDGPIFSYIKWFKLFLNGV